MDNLAELLGAIAGDGHIDYAKRYGRSIHYKLVFSGHFTEDIDYYRKVKEFLKKLTKEEMRFYKQRKNELIASIYSKRLIEYLIKSGAIPGRKTEKINFPNWLNKNEKLDFIRGIFDTDGSLTFKKKYKDKVHKYPVISIMLKSKEMIKNLSSVLIANQFYLYVGYNEKHYDKRNGMMDMRHSIYISGRKNLLRWFELIGFNNPKHATKYSIWKKYRFCPIRITIQQRRDILKNKLDPYFLI